MTVKHTPGPWQVGYNFMDVGCVNAKIGGHAKLFDVRGWGYLTGNGHGGLGMNPDHAFEVQKANARLAAAAPELLNALKDILFEDSNKSEVDRLATLVMARLVVAKAEGRS